MKRGTITGLFGTILVAGFSLGAFADVKENPYQVIIDRNPFGLKAIPIPEPPKQPEAPPIPPPEIKLTGITTLGEQPKAFLQVEDKQTKKTEFPPPLAAGENFKGLMVVSIDVENNTVRIKNDDAETTLDFVNNGVKTASAGGVAPVAHPGGIAPLNQGGLPIPPAAGAAYNPNSAIPNPAAASSGRTALVSGGTATAMGAVPNNPYLNPGGGTLPVRPLRTDNQGPGIVAGGGNQVYNPNPRPPVQPQPTLTREEAEARIEAQRQILQQKRDPTHIILPPTSLGGSINPPPAPGAPGLPQ
jgi:hypothetical protein